MKNFITINGLFFNIDNLLIIPVDSNLFTIVIQNITFTVDKQSADILINYIKKLAKDEKNNISVTDLSTDLKGKIKQVSTDKQIVADKIPKNPYAPDTEPTKVVSIKPSDVAKYLSEQSNNNYKVTQATTTQPRNYSDSQLQSAMNDPKAKIDRI